MVAKNDKPVDDDAGSKVGDLEGADESGVTIIDEDAPDNTVEHNEHVQIEDAPSHEDQEPEFDEPDLAEPAAEPVAKRGRTWVPALAGAVLALAVAIAFVVYEFRPGGLLAHDTQAIDELQTTVQTVTEQLNEVTAANSAMSAKLDAQSSDIEALSARLKSVEAALAETAGLSGAISEIETRLTDLENRPIPDVGATEEAVAAYETQLAAMRAMFEKELQQIKEQAESSASLQNSAADLQRAASIDKLSAQILVAIDEGAPIVEYTRQLADLGVAVPQALTDAADGVASIAQLAADFPSIARELVEADVREKAATGEIGRFEAFMRLQLGARSTAPKEGDDLESVVARAEASLSQGDLASAVKTLEPLRANASPALRDWLSQADAHLAAVDAATQLSAAKE